MSWDVSYALRLAHTCCIALDAKVKKLYALQGSAEATSATWPERTAQRSSSVSHDAHKTHSRVQQQAGGHVERHAVASHSNLGATPGMWVPPGEWSFVQSKRKEFCTVQLAAPAQSMRQSWHLHLKSLLCASSSKAVLLLVPSSARTTTPACLMTAITAGLDMALMQQYMQMAAGPIDPAALQMAQMAQFAAAQGLSLPPFGAFPPPGMAEQVMAAYAAGFPPFPQDPMAHAQQQAALVNAMYAQQAQSQAQPPPEVLQQAAAAAFALNQALQSAAPSVQAPDYRPHHCSNSSISHDPQLQPGSYRQQQQADKPTEGSHAGRQEGVPLLSTKIPVKDDPAFGHGRLYKPQASHAKASVAPPSTKFGGAMTDQLQCGSTLSRNSSSESVLPPVTRSPETICQAFQVKHVNDIPSASAVAHA